MTMPRRDDVVEPSDRMASRQQRLLVLAWTATLVPLLAFGYLTWQSWHLAQTVAESRRAVAAAESQVAALDARKTALDQEIAALAEQVAAQKRSTKHYRDLAGVRIQFYRASDRQLVDRALESLGFRLETSLGTSRLINASPNTIAFGSLVADEDLRDIAVALIDAGFPLKRMTPAVRQLDPRLIQIYASVDSDTDCQLLTAAQVRNGLRCGPRP